VLKTPEFLEVGITHQHHNLMALGEFRGRESSSHAKSCPRLACTSANMFVLPSSGTATAASNCAVAVSIRMAAGAVYSTGVQAMTEQG